MPMPKPKKGEKQNDFVARFMSNDTMKKDFPDNDQRLAVAISQWKDRKKENAKSEDIIKNEGKVNVKEEIGMEVDTPVTDRGDLTIANFMDDMIMLGTQVRNPQLKKPNFHYGDLSVTNYLLWLMLAELMMLNDKINGDEE